MIRQRVNCMLILLISAIYREISLSVSQLYRKIKRVCLSKMKLTLINSIINQHRFLTLIKRPQV